MVVSPPSGFLLGILEPAIVIAVYSVLTEFTEILLKATDI
jgi:hypothetical protein